MSDISPVNQTYIAQQAQAPNVEPKQVQPYTQSPIEDGDKKSMDILKWGGVIAGAAVVAGATTLAVLRHKPIPLDNVNIKDGKYFLNEGDDVMSKLERFAKGIGEDGKIKNARIQVTKTDNLDIMDIVKGGKRTERHVAHAAKDGQKATNLVCKFGDDGKPVEAIKDGVTYKYTYDPKTKKLNGVTAGDEQIFSCVRNEKGEKVYQQRKTKDGLQGFAMNNGNKVEFKVKDKHNFSINGKECQLIGDGKFKVAGIEYTDADAPISEFGNISFKDVIKLIYNQ